MNAIEIRGLEKQFSRFKLGPLDLTVPQGAGGMASGTVLFLRTYAFLRSKSLFPFPLRNHRKYYTNE